MQMFIGMQIIHLCRFLTCTECHKLPRCFSHSVSDANWPFSLGYKPGGYKPGGGYAFRPNGPCCWCGVWMLWPKTWGLGKGPILPISASFLRFAMVLMAGKGSKNCMWTWIWCYIWEKRIKNHLLNKSKHQIIFIFKIHNGQMVGEEQSCWNAPAAKRHGPKQRKKCAFIICYVKGRKEPEQGHQNPWPTAPMKSMKPTRKCAGHKAGLQYHP